MGKTSLVKKVISTITAPDLKVVYMDAYDCRSEYDFYDMKKNWWKNVRKGFISRIRYSAFGSIKSGWIEYRDFFRNLVLVNREGALQNCEVHPLYL